MEIKMQLESLRGFKFECGECKSVLTVPRDRTLMIKNCPNCGKMFEYNTYEDPIGTIQSALKAFEHVKGVKISLICEEDEEK